MILVKLEPSVEEKRTCLRVGRSSLLRGSVGQCYHFFNGKVCAVADNAHHHFQKTAVSFLTKKT